MPGYMYDLFVHLGFIPQKPKPWTVACYDMHALGGSCINKFHEVYNVGKQIPILRFQINIARSYVQCEGPIR